MKDFDLFEPSSILELFKKPYPKSAMLMAGGTDLLVGMKLKKIVPSALISLRNIPELRGISYDRRKGGRLGATTTIHEIETSRLIKDHYPILAQAASHMGSFQVRNQATVGGNLCQASPAGDMIPPLMVLKARLNLKSISDERSIPIGSFFKGPGKTALKKEEILTAIWLPPPISNSCHFFLKHSRRESVDLAIVNVAVWLKLRKDLYCEEARIALGAVAPTVIRARLSESLLQRKKLERDLIERVGEKVLEEIQPISDLRASSGYRSEISRVVTIRALRAAIFQPEAGTE